MVKFAELKLRDSILRAVEESGYEEMTKIQEQAIPIMLEGKDLIAVAQTGTGKTAAFSLPIIQHLLKREGKRASKSVGCLILAPTRELAHQIADNIRAYGKYVHLRIGLVYGGTSSKPQIKGMMGGVDILVATPGRLLDLTNQRHIDLRSTEFLVLDEADRMLDMGFIKDIRAVVAQLPAARQTVLFSATMPQAVQKLAHSLLTDPERTEVAPEQSTAQSVEQYLLMVPKALKRQLLNHVLKNKSFTKIIVFTRTKHGADRVSKNLIKSGISSNAIHGNKSQNARTKALNDFRSGEVRVLVATDVAARGIDVDGITHVINFDLPNEPESYVHRIGRTGRAKATGISLSFCGEDERAYLREIEKLIKKPIPLEENHPFHNEAIALDEEKPPVSGGGRGRGGNGGGRRGGDQSGGGEPKKFSRSKGSKAKTSKRRNSGGAKKQNDGNVEGTGNIRNFSPRDGEQKRGGGQKRNRRSEKS